MTVLVVWCRQHVRHLPIYFVFILCNTASTVVALSTVRFWLFIIFTSLWISFRTSSSTMVVSQTRLQELLAVSNVSVHYTPGHCFSACMPQLFIDSFLDMASSAGVESDKVSSTTSTWSFPSSFNIAKNRAISFSACPLCTHILSAADPVGDPVSHLPHQGLQPDGVIHII